MAWFACSARGYDAGVARTAAEATTTRSTASPDSVARRRPVRPVVWIGVAVLLIAAVLLILAGTNADKGGSGKTTPTPPRLSNPAGEGGTGRQTGGGRGIPGGAGANTGNNGLTNSGANGGAGGGKP